MKEKIIQLKKTLENPETPQGEIQGLKDRLFVLEQKQQLRDNENFEKNNNIAISVSDDYIGCDAGDYSFYYGYEETGCPIRSHKDEEDCYEKACEKREWCFVVYKNGKKIVSWMKSEFSYGAARDIEQIFIVGMCKFIKEYLK